MFWHVGGLPPLRCHWHFASSQVAIVSSSRVKSKVKPHFLVRTTRGHVGCDPYENKAASTWRHREKGLVGKESNLWEPVPKKNRFLIPIAWGSTAWSLLRSLYMKRKMAAPVICLCVKGKSVGGSSIFIYVGVLRRSYDSKIYVSQEGTARLLVFTTEQIGCSVTAKKTSFRRDTKTSDISKGAGFLSRELWTFLQTEDGEHTLHSCTSSVWCLLLRNLTLSSKRKLPQTLMLPPDEHWSTALLYLLSFLFQTSFGGYV